MENCCMGICKYNLGSPKAFYSDDSQADDHSCPPYADDAQYFDIDISMPFSPTDHTTPTSTSISSSEDDDSEDEFDLDLSICSQSSPNPRQCIPPADNLFCQDKLLPVQLIPTRPEYDMDIKDIHDSLQSSRNVTVVVKAQFPKLLKTATKLKLPLFGFRKSSNLGMDLQFPFAECGTSMKQKHPNSRTYMCSERSITLIEVQSAIQGAIAHCKKSNFYEAEAS